MAPDAFVPDPNSPEAEAQWRAGVRSQIDSLKQRETDNRVLGYKQSTVVQPGIGTVITDLTGLAVTVTVGTRRLIRITGFFEAVNNSTGLACFGYIFEGANALQVGVVYSPDMLGGNFPTIFAVAIVAPTPGTHTYKLAMGTSTGTVQHGAGYPAYIIVDDVGQAPA